MAKKTNKQPVHKRSVRKGSFTFDFTIFSLLVFLLLFIILQLYLVPKSSATANSLTWAPPDGYQSYPVKNVAVASDTQTISGGGGNMWVKLPNTPTGPITLSNCVNVVILGGQINIPLNSGPGTDRRGIYVNGCTGTVHIEGVYINGDFATAEGDGIAINAPSAIVQIQNVRIYKLYGGYDTALHNHSDVIQPWGGVKELRVDHLTGSSNYQGLQINQDTGPIEKEIIKNTNISSSEVPTPDGKGGYYIWLSCSYATTTSFENVYVNPRSGRTLSNSIWGSSCGMSINGNAASFSDPKITGSVYGGTPPAGDFVPDGVAGIGYISPGYGTTDPTPDPTTTPTADPTTDPTADPTTNQGSASTENQNTVAGTISVPIDDNAEKTEIYVNGELYKVVNKGEDATIDTSKLSNGTHTITYKTTNSDGTVTEQSKNVDVQNSILTQVLGQLTTTRGKVISGTVIGTILITSLIAWSHILRMPFNFLYSRLLR